MFKGIFSASVIYLLVVCPAYSLSLNDTIDETMKNNPDILITEKDHKSIVEALKQARAGYFPKLKANLGYGIDNSRNGNTLGIGAANPNPTMPKREIGLTLDQMIFDGFATASDVERNKARVDSAAYKIISSVQDTVQKNVEVYLSVLKEQELLALAEDNLAFHQQTVKMIRMRVDNGISKRADLFQAESRLALAQSNILAERSNLADARANFYRTIGIPADDLIMPAEPNPDYLPKTLKEAIVTAVKNNPVVQSATADINATIEQHNFANASSFPRVDLQMGMNRDRNVGGQRDPSFENYAMVRMTYTIFDGGADVGKQRETAYQEQEAKEIRMRAVRQLVEAVKLTWDLYITSRDLLPLLDYRSGESVKTVRAYGEQFQIGQRTLLDVLDSQNELFTARRAYISGRYDLLQAKYRILRDMGTSIVALNLESAVRDTKYADVINYIPKKPSENIVNQRPTHIATNNVQVVRPPLKLSE